MAINPVCLQLFKAASRHARGDCSPACFRPSREEPVVFRDLRSHNFEKLERSRGLRLVCFLIEPGGIAVEHEDHEPGIFGVVSLPTAWIPGCLDFDSIAGVLNCISGKLSRGQ